MLLPFVIQRCGVTQAQSMRYSYYIFVLCFCLILGVPLSIAKTVGLVKESLALQDHHNDFDNPPSSVLAEGEWFRFSVTESGVYKITAELLTKAGINLNSIDPHKISLYGYGGGMLPQLNSAARPIDLPELPIFISGGDDGKFDSQDFIAFYAEGPDRITYMAEEESFMVEKNLYADSAFYFLSFHNTEGKRIQETVNQGTNFSTVNTFDDYLYHEKEMYNLLSSGREWYGERFSPGSTEKLNFIVPDFEANTDVKVYARVMSSSTAPASFGLSLNGTKLGDIPVDAIPKVDFNTGQNIYAIKGQESQQWLKLNQTALNNDNLDISLTFNGTSGAGYAYLNSLLIHIKRGLVYRGKPFLFQSIESLSYTQTTFQVKKKITQEVQIWDVTDPLYPKRQQASTAGEDIQFGAETDLLRQYAIFDFDNLPAPSFVGKVKNQNIRSALDTDMLIISYPDFIPAAEKLAAFRASHDNMKVTIVTPSQIYNEFSSGRQDITAIRDYARHLYDNGSLKYLLLLGKCSYAYKDLVIENSNFVPTYQSYNSLNPVETYSSDDFFGFMEEHEGNWLEGNNAEEHDLEIGVGRLPVKTLAEAQTVIDKIIHYSSNKNTYGAWRNEVVFVADDGDANTHQQDSEKLAMKIDSTFSSFHVNKIYLGAYPQEGNSSEATQNAINDAIKKGALIVNYTGHGNESIWAEEKILTLSMINQWENYDKLSLFVVATCEFGKYDDPYQVSGGEQLLLSPKGGAIALVATSRPVYSNTNFLLNSALYDVIFTKNASESLRLGDIIKSTKNRSLSGYKNRNFTLLGDPSLKLAIPEKEIEITALYADMQKEEFDTLKALSKINIQGNVVHNDGSTAQAFNGIANVVVYDKPFTSATLSDNGPIMTFSEQNNVLFKGKASIKNGAFNVQFYVPKNINYTFGHGKISLYGLDKEALIDAHTGFTDIVIGGSAPSLIPDSDPPRITLYMDDETFQSGGLTGSNTLILARIQDESGINISSNGLGQDIVATLNDNKEYILNNFFESELDSYQDGWISYPINDLPDGNYTLKLKAWDINSNSAEKSIKFIVASNAKLVLQNVLNYPNPFSNETTFSIGHNRAGEDLAITISIYSMQGKLVKELRTIAKESSSRLDALNWDGTNDAGKLSDGVYVYKVTVQSLNDLSKTKQYKRLVIIN